MFIYSLSFPNSYNCNILHDTDPLKITELLDKLVIFKINDNEGTKMGFNGPKYVFSMTK